MTTVTRKEAFLTGALFLLNFALTTTGAGREKSSKDERFIDQPEIDVVAELLALKTEFQAFKNATRGTGSTFTRWGKNDCPRITDVIYRGYIAGKKWDDPGSSSNTLCLPADPTWANYDNISQDYRSVIYGTELDAWTSSHIFNKNVFNEDMPCVVCRSPYPTTIMIPARTNCYPGWTMQYNGYLVSNKAGVGRGSYESICIEMDPDFVPHSEADNNEHVLYLMEAKCGSLPCPPYSDGRELACVVCSQ